MKNTVKLNQWLRYIAAGAFGVMLIFNIMVSMDLHKDKNLPALRLFELGNVAMAQDESGGGVCDCSWYQNCNKRIESIIVTCESSSQTTITYFSSGGQIVGTGIVTGGAIQMTSGYQTAYYTTSSGSTGSYQATKVNCPTDGNCGSCTPYFPC